VALAAGLDLALEHADELVELAARAVELLEIGPPRLGDVELLERVLRAPVVLVDPQQALPGLDRLGGVLDLLGVEKPEALERVGAQLVVGRRVGLPAADVGELVPLLVALVELVELGERFVVGRLVDEDLLPPVRADLGLLDLGRRHLGDLDHLGAALGLGRAVDLGLLELDQLFPVAPLLVHREQVIDRLLVVGIELEHALERLDRLGLVREPLEVEVGDLQVDRDLSCALPCPLAGAVRARIAGDQCRVLERDSLGLLEQDLDQVGPPLLGLVQRAQPVVDLEPRWIWCSADDSAAMTWLSLLSLP